MYKSSRAIVFTNSSLGRTLIPLKGGSGSYTRYITSTPKPISPQPLPFCRIRQFHTTTAKMVPPIAQNRTLLSSHPDNVRMLVLETDETHPDTQKETGSFGVILGELLKKAGDEHEPSLGIETTMQYVVEPEGGAIPKLEEIGDDIHAILITGSCWDAHGDDEWILKLMKFIRGTSTFISRSGDKTTNSHTRCMGPSSRHPLYRNMFRSPNPMPHPWLNSATAERRRVGALTPIYLFVRHWPLSIRCPPRYTKDSSPPNASRPRC